MAPSATCRAACQCPRSVIAVLAVLIVCLSVRGGDAFNVDTVNFIRHRGDPGSMFGFSVAEHKELGRSWVLVGAPEAQTRQTGVDRGGAVYKCETTSDDACEQIPFDLTGNNNNSDGRQIDKKSHQWFGATVRSSGENGVVLACAPRYVWFTTTTVSRRDPVGTCYIARNQFQDFSEYSPCRTRNWGYHRQGSCQAGLGADVSKDGQRLYVGAPGSWYWQGQIYDISSSFKMPMVSPDYSKRNELNLIAYESGNKDGRNKSGSLSNKNNQQHGGGQLYAQNPNKIPEVWATTEGSPQDDDSYLGYSVASGDFDGRGTGGVAVGRPRGAKLMGKVLLFTANLTNLQNITGHQLGSYFSYSIAAVDIDGDALDDLVIGAPLYTDLSNNEGKYETGRVYIYFNEPRYDYDGYFVRFSRYTFRDGTASKSRFGLSVASLGDINKDGYGDFAVGAPYDGETNRGAVYIYHGMRKGVRETYSQVIRGEELSVPVSTFGFSVSGGLDMDGNQYPDMVVGAYESDTAIFFRSRPVVRVVESRVTFDSKNKQISLEERPCSLRDYTQVSCTEIEACLKYSGPEVSDYLDFDIGIALDVKKPKSPRMFFMNDEGKYVKNDTIRLTKGQLNCKNYFVYIKPNIRDKLTPIEAELRYNVITTSTSGSGRRYVRSLQPALDTTEQNIRKDSISIQKNCGPDNVCIPDLRLTTKKSVSKYLLGSGEKFALDVMVENRGEDAFEAVYNLEVPPGMNFVNIERLDKDRSIPVQCSAPSAFTNNTLKCDIGNPLPKGKLVNFKILLQPFHQEGMKPSYAFVSTVNSTNPEEEITSTDNLQRFTVPIWVETDLILTGSSHPAEVHYNMSHYEGNITHESHIGPQVVHVYSIRNKGPADILEAQTVFLWPSYTLAGQPLLYLLEQPETSGNVKCEWVEEANDQRLELDRKRKSYLQSGQAGTAYAAERVGSPSDYKKTSMRKGKGKMTDEERRRLEESYANIGDSEFESGDASLIHGKRVQLQSSGGRRTNGSVGGGGGVYITGGRAGTSSSGSWSSQGSGVRYDESHRRGGGGGSQYHWSEESMHGRRVGGGYSTESDGASQDGYYYVDRNRHDESDWGTPADNEDAMRRAYGGNEFRTVALDLNSNIPVLNIGSDQDEVLRGRHHGGSRTRITSTDEGGVHGSRTYEEGGRTYTASSEERRRLEESGRTQGGTVSTHHVSGGSVGGGRTETTSHVSQGGSRTYEVHGGSYDTEEERRRVEGGERTQGGTVSTHHMLHVSGGGDTDGARTGGSRTQTTSHVSQGGSRTYEVHGGSYDTEEERRRVEGGERTQGGIVSTHHMLHVGGGTATTGSYDTDEERRRHEEGVATGGSHVQTTHVSHGGSRTYEVHGGSYGTDEERRRQEEAAGGSRTVHVSQGGSRTYEVHGGSSGYDTEEERRRHEEDAGGSRTIHVSQGGSRTYEVHGGSYDTEGERRRHEEGGSRTVHVSQGGGRTYEVHGGSSGHDTEEERRRHEEAGGGSRTVHVSQGGSRTYEVHGGSSGYDTEEERRRHEEAYGGSRTYDVHGGSYDTDEERRRHEEGGSRTVHISQGGSRSYEVHGGTTRTGDADYDRRKYEEGHISQSGGSRTYVTQGGTSRTYEHGDSYDRDYDRRIESESTGRAGGSVEGSRHYSTEYGYHMNGSTVGSGADGGRVANGSGYFIWENVSSGRGREFDRRLQEDIERRMREKADQELQEIIRKAGGGRIVDGGSSRWIVFDNGTVITASSTHNPEYEKQLREEFQRRLKEQMDREREERLRQSGSGSSYEHRSSYDQEYERRRLEHEAAERARAGAGSTHHYQTEYRYQYNTTQTGGDAGGRFAWDGHLSEYERRVQEDMQRRMRGKSLSEIEEMLGNSGGRVVEGGTARWVVFLNGTIVSVGQTENPEYEKRLREEYIPRLREQLQREMEKRMRESGGSASEGRTTHWYSYNESSEYSHDPDYQRRLQEEWDRRAREEAARYGSSQEHYYNRSYSSESRYTRQNKKFETDSGRELPVKDADLAGEKNIRRTRHRFSGNSIEDDDLNAGKRQKAEDLIPRFRRMVESGEDLKSSLRCGPTECTKIMCTVGPLARGQEAWVAFRGRIWAQTLQKLGHDRVIRLSSLAASQLTKLPHIGEPESAKVETHEVFTEVMPQDAPLKPEVAPLWIWVLSACAGTLILLLLIFLLWKLGFFKRNRPSTAPEKQPLNRNGYQAGDEAL